MAGDKKTETLKDEADRLKWLIALAKCPECDGSGVIQYTGAGGTPEQDLCSWCLETHDIKAEYAKSLQALKESQVVDANKKVAPVARGAQNVKA